LNVSIFPIVVGILFVRYTLTLIKYKIIEAVNDEIIPIIMFAANFLEGSTIAIDPKTNTPTPKKYIIYSTNEFAKNKDVNEDKISDAINANKIF